MNNSLMGEVGWSVSDTNRIELENNILRIISNYEDIGNRLFKLIYALKLSNISIDYYKTYRKLYYEWINFIWKKIKKRR